MLASLVVGSPSPLFRLGLSPHDGQMHRGWALCHISLALGPHHTAAVDMLAAKPKDCKDFFHCRVDGFKPTAREHLIDRNIQKRDRKSQRRKIHPG